MKKMIIALALAGVAVPGAAQAQDYDSSNAVAADKAGVRVEGRVSWERINDPEEDAGINYEVGSGIAYGGEIGVDFPVSERVVLGPYVNYEASSVEDCADGLCVGSDGFWSAGIHAGLITGQSGMVYAKLGYGEQTIYLDGEFYDAGTNTTFVFDESETGGGYAFAMGYEHGFTSTLYGRAEVGVSEASDIYGFDFQRGHIGLSLGARF